MVLNIESINFIKEQTKKRLISIIIKLAICIGIFQLIVLGMAITNYLPALMILFVPTYIFILIIIILISINDYRKSKLYKYAQSYANPNDIILSLKAEFDQGKKIGKTIFTDNWIIAKKHNSIDRCVTYDDIDNVYFELHGWNLNLMPMHRTYIMYIVSGNSKLSFELGGFKKRRDMALEIINQHYKTHSATT